MRFKPTQSTVAVVMLGNFNPRIFLPSWFARNGVIGPEEGESADIEIVHREVVKFRLSWLTILVEQGRFIADLDQPPNVRLLDLVLKTFGELMIHTPIWAMGINRKIEFDAGSVDARDKIGKTLAPPDAWGEWSKDILRKSDKARGGMVSLSMRQSTVEDDRPGGYILTRVEPSKRSISEVMVEVNDHYQIDAKEEAEGCQEILGLLADNFDKSIERSEWIIDQVMSIVK